MTSEFTEIEHPYTLLLLAELCTMYADGRLDSLDLLDQITVPLGKLGAKAEGVSCKLLKLLNETESTEQFIEKGVQLLETQM